MAETHLSINKLSTEITLSRISDSAQFWQYYCNLQGSDADRSEDNLVVDEVSNFEVLIFQAKFCLVIKD